MHNWVRIKLDLFEFSREVFLVQPIFLGESKQRLVDFAGVVVSSLASEFLGLLGCLGETLLPKPYGFCIRRVGRQNPATISNDVVVGWADISASCHC